MGTLAPHRRSPRPLLVAVQFAAASSAALLLTTTGCVLKRPPDATAIKGEALPEMTLPGQWTAAGEGAGMVGNNWLNSFRDDQLSHAALLQREPFARL